MMEMRWLEYQVEETVVPEPHEISYGSPFEKRMVTKRKLQYRQKVDVTVRAGMFNNAAPDFQWSEWRDVPTVSEDQL